MIVKSLLKVCEKFVKGLQKVCVYYLNRYSYVSICALEAAQQTAALVRAGGCGPPKLSQKKQKEEK